MRAERNSSKKGFSGCQSRNVQYRNLSHSRICRCQRQTSKHRKTFERTTEIITILRVVRPSSESNRNLRKHCIKLHVRTTTRYRIARAERYGDKKQSPKKQLLATPNRRCQQRASPNRAPKSIGRSDVLGRTSQDPRHFLKRKACTTRCAGTKARA